MKVASNDKMVPVVKVEGNAMPLSTKTSPRVAASGIGSALTSSSVTTTVRSRLYDPYLSSPGWS